MTALVGDVIWGVDEYVGCDGDECLSLRCLCKSVSVVRMLRASGLGLSKVAAEKRLGGKIYEIKLTTYLQLGSPLWVNVHVCTEMDSQSID